MLTASTKRTLQCESNPAPQGCPGTSPIHPLQRHQACLPHAEEWAQRLLTWRDNRQHWDSIIRLDLWARLIKRQQKRYKMVKTTALWYNFITHEKPGGPEYLLWMHSGFPPTWDGTNIKKPLEWVQAGGSLSSTTAGRSSNFRLFISLPLFKATSASAFLPSYFLFQRCLLITESAHAMLLS